MYKSKVLSSLVFCLVLVSPIDVMAFGSAAGTCDVVADYSSITGMSDRTQNPNNGSYVLTSNVSEYTMGDNVELTIEGPVFTGIVFAVVDDNGDNVGNFVFDDFAIQACDSALTHTNDFGSVVSYTFSWIAPATDVGPVHVIGYILSGTRGNTSNQEFFRFVRDDSSAISLNNADSGPVDLIFMDDFEGTIPPKG